MRLVLAACAVVALSLPATAAADLADETALAERYAPVVRLVEQARGVRLRASRTSRSTSTLLFDEPTVALRGPWGGGDLVKIAPAADDSRRERFEYHLDFPGNALDPGCDYERWARRLTEGTHADGLRARGDRARPARASSRSSTGSTTPSTTGTTLHEGDWEMIQLVFDAADARRGARARAGRGRLQPARGRRAGDLGRRQARARRRDASRRAPGGGLARELLRRGALLGSSAVAGRRLRRHDRADVRRPPGGADDPERSRRRPRAAFPWIEFEGRWGELQRAFFNGPTGPNLKSQWTEPDRVVRGLARPQPRRPGRRRARHGRDRLLLRRHRGGFAARCGAPSTIRCRSSRARRPRSRSSCSLLVAHDVAPGRAAPPRPPTRLGPGARGRRRACTSAGSRALPRDRARRSCPSPCS